MNKAYTTPQHNTRQTDFYIFQNRLIVSVPRTGSHGEPGSLEVVNSMLMRAMKAHVEAIMSVTTDILESIR